MIKQLIERIRKKKEKKYPKTILIRRISSTVTSPLKYKHIGDGIYTIEYGSFTPRAQQKRTYEELIQNKLNRILEEKY